VGTSTVPLTPGLNSRWQIDILQQEFFTGTISLPADASDVTATLVNGDFSIDYAGATIYISNSQGLYYEYHTDQQAQRFGNQILISHTHRYNAHPTSEPSPLPSLITMWVIPVRADATGAMPCTGTILHRTVRTNSGGLAGHRISSADLQIFASLSGNRNASSSRPTSKQRSHHGQGAAILIYTIVLRRLCRPPRALG
jgi:hypothetical protein